jgi:ATP-dependent RNA helicase DOB1
MSGRAGRRGLDKKGITILMVDEKMEPDVARNMLKGNSDDLLSSFYINTNMLINSQRLEDMDPEYIIRRSFLQFQNDIKLPKLTEEHNKKVQRYEQLRINDQSEVERLYYIVQRINDYKEDIRKATMKPSIALGYLCVGRIIRLKQGNIDWGYGVSVNFHAQKDKKDKKKAKEE